MEQSKFKGYANSFQAIARLGLENIGCLLAHLGNPQDKLRFVHIAGTNGKGSVAAFLSAMLTHAGYRTGSYISPNMLRVNERISIDGTEVTDEAMKRLFTVVETACKAAEADTGVYPTQFEIWTAMAFCYFAQQDCDYVVLETGLGGRRDATNIVTTTVLSVITHIALDHMQYLGDTIAQIAAEKAGIIKCGTKTVSARQEADAAEVLRRVCIEKENPLTFAEQILPGSFDGIYEILSSGDFAGVKLSLGGVNQIDNAACAIAAARALGIHDGAIRYGLTHAVNRGRFEQVGENTYFDGAHNPDGVSALVENLNRYFPGREKTFIMATMYDKDVRGALRLLHDGKSDFKMVAVADNERSMSAQELAQIAKAEGLDAAAYPSIQEAYASAQAGGRLIVVCGSLYLYKDFAEMSARNEEK